MPQKTRIVGLDVAKSKACIRSVGRLSASSTPEGRAELAAWLRANRVGRAVMEASGGYERDWAKALRAAGVEVLIVDPRQVRCFARARRCELRLGGRQVGEKIGFGVQEGDRRPQSAGLKPVDGGRLHLLRPLRAMQLM